jgi:hypothetical protein
MRKITLIYHQTRNIILNFKGTFQLSFLTIYLNLSI